MNATPNLFNNSQVPTLHRWSRLREALTSRRLHFLLSFLAIAVVMVIMLRISWEKWGDTIIDTGRELYIPWQLSAGKVLYRFRRQS